MADSVTQPANWKQPEGYCLMQYASEDGNEVEYIWNSRNAVTPFMVTSELGTTLRHVDWQGDRYLPEFRPHPGMRIFIDMTPERKSQLQREQIEGWFATNNGGIRERWPNADAAFDDLYQEPAPGEPDLIHVVDFTALKEMERSH